MPRTPSSAEVPVKVTLVVGSASVAASSSFEPPPESAADPVPSAAACGWSAGFGLIRVASSPYAPSVTWAASVLASALVSFIAPSPSSAASACGAALRHRPAATRAEASRRPLREWWALITWLPA